MIFIILYFSVLVKCGMYQSRAAISKIFLLKSFDSEHRANSMNMSEFVTKENWQYCKI